MLSLGKLCFLNMKEHTVFKEFCNNIWERCSSWCFETERRRADGTAAEGTIASSSNMGSWTSFELFSIQSGDKNTLAGWTSDLFYDHNSCSRQGQEEPTTAHLLHVLMQKALIIIGDARQGRTHLVEGGPRGKGPLYFKSQHLHWYLRAPATSSAGLNFPQEDQHLLHYTSLLGGIRMRCVNVQEQNGFSS